MQVVLLERSIWNSVPTPMPALAVMSAHGEYDGQSTGTRVYPNLGCADAACRNPGWTVEYSVVVLTSRPVQTVAMLQEDASLLRTHLKETYRDLLLQRNDAINIKIAMIGPNDGYQVDTEVHTAACFHLFPVTHG
jgi:hypothetical protein